MCWFSLVEFKMISSPFDASPNPYIICTTLKQLNLQYPKVSDEHRQQLLQAKAALENEFLTLEINYTSSKQVFNN
jgi:hypothetical protein